MRPLLLRRLEDGFSEVQRAWEGTAAVCIGGGPSLTPEQCAAVWQANLPVVAINDAYRIAGFSDVCYFPHARWYANHKHFLRYFGGQLCMPPEESDRVADERVHVLRDPARGGHAGHQAIEIAVASGANPILLLGYDAREDVEKAHWFGDHPSNVLQVPRRAYRGYRESLRALAPKIEQAGRRVINCSPGSAVDAFEKMSLEDALRLLAA